MIIIMIPTTFFFLKAISTIFVGIAKKTSQSNIKPKAACGDRAYKLIMIITVVNMELIASTANCF